MLGQGGQFVLVRHGVYEIKFLQIESVGIKKVVQLKYMVQETVLLKEMRV